MADFKPCSISSTEYARPSAKPHSDVVVDHPSRKAGIRRTRSQVSSDVSGTKATAEYIAQLTSELAKLAEGQRLTVLTYLLEMAAIEANGVAAASGKR